MAEENSPANDEIDSENDEYLIKLDQKFVIVLKSTQINQTIEKNAKQSCKVLQITSALDIDQKLAFISTLDSSEYPNLFFFIFEDQNGNFMNENEGSKVKQLEEYLIKLGKSRPLVILHTLVAENETKFYYKAENSTQFVDIDQFYSEDLGLYEEYKVSLESFLYQDLESFEDQILKKLSYINDLSIILRFLRTLDIQEAYFYSIVLKIAKIGSKTDLLAFLDASFADEGRILSKQAQNYIRWDYKDDELSGDDQNMKESGSEISSDEYQDNLMDEKYSQSKNKDSSQSVLLTAIQHLNKEIIEYLLTYCTHLIQQLPIKHQIRVSTAAFDTKQFDVLCDLLNDFDFPFPDKFTFTKSKIYENLRNITESRMEFKAAIEREEFDKIDIFIDNNQNHKFIYSIDNNSALTEAFRARQFGVFYYLKSLGFQGENCQDILINLKKEEASAAIEVAKGQRKTNIQSSLKNYNRSIYNLCGKSLIHNRKIKKELEAKYREYIKNWFISIHKIAPEMIDVAASCEHLKIIFDFESHTVENASLADPISLGTSYSSQKWIFIGAKFTDKAQEQKIKGILAHELCHYVMNMVYENQELPHYKEDKTIEKMFKEIVAVLDKWSRTKTVEPDDECDGIISTVYRRYGIKEFGPELIVRVVNILANFDHNQEKSNFLKEKFQLLFDFWYDQVVPEMLNYFKKDKVAMRVNVTAGLLKSLLNTGIEMISSKNMEQLTQYKATIVTTNVPRLLLINVYSHLEDASGCFVKSQNLFLEPEKIMNEQVWTDLKDLHFRDVKLNVIVDCTKESQDKWSKILGIKEFNFILVAANKKQTTKLKNICNKNKINPETVDVNYKWSDLTDDSQIYLLETKVNFQNSLDFSLMELLSKPTDEDELRILGEFSDIINDQLFNLLVNDEDICLNSMAENQDSQNFLYQMRNFLKKGVSFKNEISQEKLISITENYKYVLVSDIAGSGKSWVVKNISKIIQKETPTRWVTYVDLKQYIEQFKKQVMDLNFASFFVEKILEFKAEFEAKIFKKLYEIGKVLIIFDGFDEIAPNCADFVAALAESFESNDGNQLWIVTRDYFEIDLQEKLGIKNVYKLNEFTEQEGIDFIAKNWILMDQKDQKVKDLVNFVKNSPNLTKYREEATKIVQNITVTKNQSIGLPQLFSMIASSNKDDNFNVNDLKRAKIFTQFVNKMYKRWIYEKGVLNIERNVNSQHYMLGFIKFHQYCAIASLFPELVHILFPDYDKSEWAEEDVVACGIIVKISNLIYSFVHETFREFFVADFIYKSLKDPKILNLLIQVLTVQKYGIIRMFLNDFVDNYSAIKNVQLEFERSIEKIYNMENLSEIFIDNQEHFANLVIAVLKKGNYENVKKLISDNFKAIATKTRELQMFLTFTEFMFSFVKPEDLVDIIVFQNILQEIIGSDQELEIIEIFVAKLENEFGSVFVQHVLKFVPKEDEAGNIFYHLAKAQNLSQHKVEKFFEIIKKYLNEDEIIELMDSCTQLGHPIFNILVQKTGNFKAFIDGAEPYFKDQKMLSKLKVIASKIDSNGHHILFLSANKEGIEFHESLWNLIKKTFEDEENLGTFMLHKNSRQDTFLHLLIMTNKSDVIELTLNKLKEILKQEDYKEILRSKGQLRRNLIQCAAENSKEVKTSQIMWKKLRDSCESEEEFLEILGDVDENGTNVLELAAVFSTIEILKFIQAELEKIGMKEKVKKLFTNLGYAGRHLLQAAVLQKKSLELHKILWEILKNYFNSSELLEFAKHCDAYGDNLLLSSTEENTKEVAEQTWNEVKEQLISLELLTEDEKENIQKCEEIIERVSESNKLMKDEKEILKLKWIKSENMEVAKLFDEASQKLIEQNLKVINLKNVKILFGDRNIENHEKLWANLIGKDRRIIEKLATEVGEKGNNFVHLLVIYNTAEIIEFTLNKFKENLHESNYKKLLKSKGQAGRNLIQIAASTSNEVKTHQILWKEVQKSCNSDEEFLQILDEVDVQGNDIFNIAASFTTGEIFEFMYQKLVKVASPDEIKNIFIKLRIGNQNLLQAAARQNISLELHKIIWKIFKQNFKSFEILEFAKHFDDFGDNLLIDAKKFNTNEIVEFTWTEVKEVLTKLFKDTETVEKIEECEKVLREIEGPIKNIENEKEINLLQLNWIKNLESEPEKVFSDSAQDLLGSNLIVENLNNLKEFASKRNIEFHINFWSFLLKSSKRSEYLEELVSKKDKNGDIFIHYLVAFNTVEVVEFTLNKLKENLSNSDYLKMWRSKGQFERNLIQIVASFLKEVKIHQVLWKEFRDSCKSDEEFLEIFEDVDKNGDSVLDLAATFLTGNILKFMQTELEKFGLKDKFKKLLTHLGYAGRNLLQAAAQQNRSLELNEVLWEILKDYFDDPEILEFIKHRDGHGYNLLLNSLKGNTKEVKELTLKKVRELLVKIGFKNNENLKLIDEIIKFNKKFEDLTKDEIKCLKLEWIGSENSVKLFEGISVTSVKCLNDLKLFMSDPNVENHENYWKQIEQKFSKYEEMKKLLFEKDENGNNFIHFLVIFKEFEIIEFTLKKLEEILNEADYKEMLTSKEQLGRNLLQVAAIKSKYIETHKILWKKFRESCKTDEEFMSIIEEIDMHGNNILHLAAAFATSEIFEFIVLQLEKLPKNKKKLIELLSSCGYENENLLQCAIVDNKNLEAHKTIWRVISKYFETIEILDLIKHCDKDGDNLFCNVVLWNTKEIVEFTWNQIKIFIDTKESQLEYLNRKGHKGKNLHQLSLENVVKDLNVAAWVQKIMQEYEN